VDNVRLEPRVVSAVRNHWPREAHVLRSHRLLRSNRDWHISLGDGGRNLCKCRGCSFVGRHTRHGDVRRSL
jgi:hypothetical protein